MTRTRAVPRSYRERVASPIKALVPAGCWESWSALMLAIWSAGDDVPCTSPASSSCWTSEVVEERQLAVLACRECPVLAECADYARIAGEDLFVYGGLDMSEQD